MPDSDDELTQFCRQQHPRLVGALSLYCGDRLVAEELAQEALLRACTRWRRIRELQAPGAWVHRVALNLANSHYRRRKAERRANARHGPDQPERVPDRADALAVRAAVAGLPARQRQALVLRYFLDYSVEDTAAVLGVSTGAVQQLTHRAVVVLRRRLGAAEGSRGVAGVTDG